MKYILILCVTFFAVMASDLEYQYELYAKYLNMDRLDLNNEQLKKIVPKLEAKIKKDKNYKKTLQQLRLEELKKVVKHTQSFDSNRVEQTICFSKDDCSKFSYATLGNEVNLCGGECQGKTLKQMNAKGWELIQVISGLQSSFGMILTRKK